MTTGQANVPALTLETAPVHIPATHYVFVERRGSFQVNAPQAWQDLHAKLATIAEHNTVQGYLSLYKIDEEVYRAGVSVAEPAQQLPAEVAYQYFSGGVYTKFVLRGSYAQLPAATQEAVRLFRERGLPRRNDFNIEHYVNDPRVTPEEELITEILLPVAGPNSPE